MPQNVFKIYDGRNHFSQWDTKQKLIVLDERITEVRFSNTDMEHSKPMPVYTNNDGIRICGVPDVLLQLPKNLIAYACIENDDGTCSTIKTVKFAVLRQPIPADYICEQDAAIENIMIRLELLEDTGHSHDNAAELDKIDDGDKAKWDAKLEDVTTSTDSGLKAVRTDNTVDIEIDDSLTFVFDCGGAN